MLQDQDPSTPVASVSSLPTEQATQLARLARIFASQTRCLLFFLLARADGTLSVNKLVELMGFAQPTISFHLRQFRNARLVEVNRLKNHSYYQIRWERFKEVQVVLMSLNMDQIEQEVDTLIGQPDRAGGQDLSAAMRLRAIAARKEMPDGSAPLQTEASLDPNPR